MLELPSVLLVGVHDAASEGAAFAKKLQAHPSRLLLTSDATYRRVFGHLDTQANTNAMLTRLQRGPGLWIGGDRAKLAGRGVAGFS